MNDFRASYPSNLACVTISSEVLANILTTGQIVLEGQITVLEGIPGGAVLRNSYVRDDVLYLLYEHPDFDKIEKYGKIPELDIVFRWDMSWRVRLDLFIQRIIKKVGF